MRTLTALVALLVCSSPAVAFPDPNSDDCIVSREVSPHAKVDCTYKYEYEKILNYFSKLALQQSLAATSIRDTNHPNPSQNSRHEAARGWLGDRYQEQHQGHLRRTHPLRE